MNMINITRRRLFKSLALITSVALIPSWVFAAWPKTAFEALELNAAIKHLYGSEPIESDQVKLKAPDIAENGAVVPITVSTDMADVTGISIYAEGNPNPLVASFDLGEFNVASVSTRIKMGKTANVVAAVHAGGKVYIARQEIKVTIGGCGG